MLTFSGDNWTVGPPLPHAVSGHCMALSEDGKVYIIGGQVRNNGGRRSFTYDISNGSFEDIKEETHSPRKNSGCGFYR